jgi:hypothetical protein
MIYEPYLSASAIDRYLACSGSAHLARVRSESAAAQAGTEQHEARLRPGWFPDNLVRWFGAMPKFEEAYGVDSDRQPIAQCVQSDGVECGGCDKHYIPSSLFFGAYTGRSYPCPGPGWIVGSADARHCASTTISVGDLKTGRAQLGGSLGKPEHSGQLRTLAYLLLRYGQSVRHDWQPSRVRLAWFLDNGSEVAIDDAEIAVDDLRQWGDDLLSKARRTRGATVPTLSPSSHCDYCPCFDACPVMGGSIRRLLEIATEAPLSSDRLIGAFTLVQRAKREAESVSRAISSMLVQHGEAIGETHVLKLTSRKARVIDPTKGLAALTEAIAAQGNSDAETIARRCLSQTMTGESIKRGLETDDAEPIMKLLADAGAITERQSVAFPSLVKRRG